PADRRVRPPGGRGRSRGRALPQVRPPGDNRGPRAEADRARRRPPSQLLSATLTSRSRPREGGVKRKSVAVFPGSFDPITNGHLDIVQRALSIFGEIVMAILVNSEKKPLFTVDERREIIRESFKDSKRVRVDTFSGLLVDYAEKIGASVIVRGLRAISDFEYEFQMALMNRRLDPKMETVFMMPAE